MRSRMPPLPPRAQIKRPLTTSARRSNQNPNLPPSQLSSPKDLGFTTRPNRQRDFSKLDLQIRIPLSGANSINLAHLPQYRPHDAKPLPVVPTDRDAKSVAQRSSGQYKQGQRGSEQTRYPRSAARTGIASDSARAFLPAQQGASDSRTPVRNGSSSVSRATASSPSTSKVAPSPSSTGNSPFNSDKDTSKGESRGEALVAQSSPIPRAPRKPVSDVALDDLNSDVMQDLMDFDTGATIPARADQRSRASNRSDQQSANRPDPRSGQLINRSNQHHGQSPNRPDRRSGPSQAANAGGHPRSPPAHGASSNPPPRRITRSSSARQSSPLQIRTSRPPGERQGHGEDRSSPVERKTPPPPRIVPVNTTFEGAFGNMSLLKPVVLSPRLFSSSEKRKEHLSRLAGSYAALLPKDLPPPYASAVAAKPVERAKSDAAWTMALNQDVSMNKARAVREIMTKFTR